ncbi:unnamed protein product [Cyclocybe aegerita]|uniref:DUF6830 domain-containing protein n=1 Tax=Cyclocybe aegerita TaxID=1973307 RepID=A0A8S0WJS1_CYCAE|nr:unnamed protein product [Cyclocybe aegerita]
MAAIDEYLKLELTKGIHLSFQSAKDLRNRIEILPSGPKWKSRTLAPKHPTKNPIVLYHRDPIECVQSLLRSPLLQDHLSFTPFRLFESSAKLMRVYTEWLLGNAAWFMQEMLPPDGTLLGTILSSDKTNISIMTGGRVAHPLLISLANLSMEFRNKASNHAFLLLALIPIPKYLHRNQKIRGILENRLYHECLDIITEPLKIAAQIGVMLSDPLGFQRWCFTPLAAHIVDTPESILIAGVGGKTSSYLESDLGLDPWDLDGYEKESTKHRLNGVHRPFWRDWPLSEPPIFLTSEPLHHWHKEFWDHDMKWCIKAVGGHEIDFRFSILHPRVGFQHFKEGVSTLKQVTGREHRDIQRYIVPVIAGAVSGPFLIAIRALIDFRYLAQVTVISDNICTQIENALRTFHNHKQAILDAGARCGKNGPIENWYIPKLEFMQSVVSNIKYNGAAIQWSADVTENAHIWVVKDPANSGNNQKYEPQICWYLDRVDKLDIFDLATVIAEAGLDFRGVLFDTNAGNDKCDWDTEDEEDDAPLLVNATGELMTLIDPVKYRQHSGRKPTDYFYRATLLKRGLLSTASQPPRTHRSAENVVFHLRHDPSFKRLFIDEVAQSSSGAPQFHISAVGGHRFAQKDCQLPFTHVEVWEKVRLQTTAYHDPHPILPPITINAAPLSEAWPHGNFDQAIFNMDPSQKWPNSGLNGHLIADVRLIFHIVPSTRSDKILKDDLHQAVTGRFLAYIQRYDIISHLKDPKNPATCGPHPEPSSGLHLLKHGMRTNGELIGDVVPLCQLRALADVSPRLGQKADRKFTKQNSLHYSTEFWLNKYFDKETFYALH